MRCSHSGREPAARQLHAARGRCSRWRQWRPAAAEGQGSPLGLLLEVDSVLVDTHTDGHRVAFNRAFIELGYECAQWSPAVYWDLLQRGDGTGPGLVTAYYMMMGWPMLLPSNERGAFVKKVHDTKVRILREMTLRGEVPLRPGVTQLIDDALADGAVLAAVAGTASSPEDNILSSATLNLGPARASQLRYCMLGGEDGAVLTSGDELPPVSFEQAMLQAQAEAKSLVAQSFSRAVNEQKPLGLGIGVDPKLMAAQARAGLISPAFVTALVATLDCTLASTVLVAGQHSLMSSGKSVGLLVAAVPPSLAARGGYGSADAQFDGFGAGGGVTWRKLRAMLEARRPQA